MSYYERCTTTNVDGTPIFKTDEDERSEAEVAAIASEVWNCQFHAFGRLSPVDWWVERDGRLVAVAELKTRTHDHRRYPTVFLNLRKWSALTMMSAGTGRPAFFVVRFTDGIYWVNVAQIDASKVIIGGCKKFVKARSDIEPVIEVPVAQLTPLVTDATRGAP